MYFRFFICIIMCFVFFLLCILCIKCILLKVNRSRTCWRTASGWSDRDEIKINSNSEEAWNLLYIVIHNWQLIFFIVLSMIWWFESCMYYIKKSNWIIITYSGFLFIAGKKKRGKKEKKIEKEKKRRFFFLLLLHGIAYPLPKHGQLTSQKAGFLLFISIPANAGASGGLCPPWPRWGPRRNWL